MKSLTSLCRVYEGTTQVYFCHNCGHVQSSEISNIDEYYDSEYDILIESDEEDQIYEIIDGENIYRTQHQIKTILDKINLTSATHILDYGCAKSSMMSALLNKVQNINAYLFDVSDRYISFWEKFLPSSNWATYEMPSSWNEKFDVVVSFFSLEHMAHPKDAVQQIYKALKLNGVFYGVIPNTFSNPADMIVADHVNHFTPTSLSYLLQSRGFELIELDEKSHRGAFIFVAKKLDHSVYNYILPGNEISNIFNEAKKIAQRWNNSRQRINEFLQTIPEDAPLAIYGAGFYGAFILSSLPVTDRVKCIIDQNPFLHGKEMNGLNVRPPSQIPNNVYAVLVGLNPIYAKGIIREISDFSNSDFKFFFL